MNTCLWLKFLELHQTKAKEVKLCAACNFIIWAVSARLSAFSAVSLTTALNKSTPGAKEFLAHNTYSHSGTQLKLTWFFVTVKKP